MDLDQVIGKIIYETERKIGAQKTRNINAIHSRVIEGASLQMADILHVAAHGQLKLTVTPDVGQAKEGAFVEGFIRFKSVDKNQPDLNIPYMGFYGDWHARTS